MRNKNAKVSNPNDFVTSPGSEIHILYNPKIQEDGTIILVESGKENIQEFIDSFRGSTDMSFIISRLAAGDLSVINQRPALYGDFTDFPKTYAEALQRVIDAQQQFYTLPLEVRNSFDNDYMKWFATSGSDDWMVKMASVLPVEESPEEVKIDES